MNGRVYFLSLTSGIGISFQKSNTQQQGHFHRTSTIHHHATANALPPFITMQLQVVWKAGF